MAFCGYVQISVADFDGQKTDQKAMRIALTAASLSRSGKKYKR
jgi:hypothetical protein